MQTHVVDLVHKHGEHVKTPGGAKWFELPVGAQIYKHDIYKPHPHVHEAVKAKIPKHSHANLVSVHHGETGEHIGYASKMVGPMSYAHANEPLAVYSPTGEKVGYASHITHAHSMLVPAHGIHWDEELAPGLESTVHPEQVYKPDAVYKASGVAGTKFSLEPSDVPYIDVKSEEAPKKYHVITPAELEQEQMTEIQQMWQHDYVGSQSDAENPSIVEQFIDWMKEFQSKIYAKHVVNQALEQLYPDMYTYEQKMQDMLGHSVGSATPQAPKPTLQDAIVQALGNDLLSPEAIAKRIADARNLMANEPDHVGALKARPSDAKDELSHVLFPGGHEYKSDWQMNQMVSAEAKRQVENGLYELLKPLFDDMSEDDFRATVEDFNRKGGEGIAKMPDFIYKAEEGNPWSIPYAGFDRSMVEGAGYIIIDRGEPGFNEALQRYIVTDMVHAWAIGSNNNTVADALQTAAEHLFNLDPGGTYRYHTGTSYSKSFLSENRVLIDEFLRAMYANTQAYLKQLGIKSLPLARTMHFGEYGGIPSWLQDFNVGESAEIPLSPLNSFATHPQEGFGGYTFWTEVPAEKVLGIPGVGLGCWEEFEVVVIGGATTVTRLK